MIDFGLSDTADKFPVVRRYLTPQGQLNTSYLIHEIDFVVDHSQAAEQVFFIAARRLLARESAEITGVKIGLGLASLGHYRGGEGSSVAESCLARRPVIRLGRLSIGEVTGPTRLLLTNLKAVNNGRTTIPTRVDPIVAELAGESKIAHILTYENGNSQAPYNLARRTFRAIDATMHGRNLRVQEAE